MNKISTKAQIVKELEVLDTKELLQIKAVVDQLVKKKQEIAFVNWDDIISQAPTLQGDDVTTFNEASNHFRSWRKK